MTTPDNFITITAIFPGCAYKIMSVLKQALQHKGNDAQRRRKHRMDTNKNELSMNELEEVNGGWDLKSLWESFKNWFCKAPKKRQKKKIKED